jgi:hypothetical protein
MYGNKQHRKRGRPLRITEEVVNSGYAIAG